MSRGKTHGRTLVLTLAATLLCLGASDETRRFDGRRAYDYLVKQCDFGPRNPGSAGHEQCRAFLVAELGKYSDKVTQREFAYADRKKPGNEIRGTNIVAEFPTATASTNAERILLCAHWDTRPAADKDPDRANRNKPVPGANDGASGVAVMLEMARLLKEKPPPVPVDIVLFDLEDIGDYGAERQPDRLNQFAVGSEHFAAENAAAGDAPQYRFGILLDMIGDKDLKIAKEGHSIRYAPEIVDMVWRAARQVGAKAFVDENGPTLMDDHLPFLKRGTKVIDLIDFDYAPWHTVADTPDKCSADSLQQVGDVLVEVIYGR